MRYKEWSKGFISLEASAHLLFTKYLLKSLTEGYEELRTRKGSYIAMKHWLIDQYGMIKGVCDSTLKVVKALKPPKSEDDLLCHSQYLRKVHRAISMLYAIEINKGLRVPGLQEHMESNTFLMQLSEVLPKAVQQKWSKFLSKSGITTWRVEGKIYLDKVLDILREAYIAKEIHARIPGNEKSTKLKAKAGHAARDGSPPTGGSSSQQASAADNSSKQRGKPANTKDSGAKPKGKKTSNSPASKRSRWSCPINVHEEHELGSCE